MHAVRGISLVNGTENSRWFSNGCAQVVLIIVSGGVLL